jgi:ribonuclease Z
MAEKIKIIFLGTSSTVPTITRNHSAIHLKYKNEDLLIDCGEGTQRQIRKAKLNPCKLTRLLITHLHGDHTLGIPGLFQTLNLNGYKKTLQIYGPKGTKQFIKNIFKTFIATKTISIKTEVKEITRGKVFDTKDFEISSLPLEHGTPTLGYIFQEKDRVRIDKKKLKKLKLSVEDKPKLQKLTQKKNIKINKKTINYKTLTYPESGRKVSIVLDTKLIPNVKKLAKDADIAIIESTFLDKYDMAKDGYYKHLTAEQAAKAAKAANVKKLYLTHLSQRYEHKANLLLKQAKKFFPDVEVARDFQVVEI